MCVDNCFIEEKKNLKVIWNVEYKPQQPKGVHPSNGDAPSSIIIVVGFSSTNKSSAIKLASKPNQQLATL